MQRLLATVVVFCFAAPLAAQDTRGAISGSVTDQQGAIVSGAAITVTNTGTNISAQLTTNSTGFYEARLLQPGAYRVTASAQGFKKVVRSGLTIGLGQEVTIDLKLEVGALTESVTITGETPILETDSVSTGRALTTRELMDLPVMTNNILLQAMLAPGVQSPGTTQYLSQGQIGGSSGSYFSPGNVGGNEWTIDGQPNQGSGRNTAFTPNTDMVEEFKVETSNFDASFGHSTGLNLQVSTKSGTNRYHGTLTEQYLNAHWNAAPFFVKQNFYSKIATARAAGNIALADQLASHYITPGGHDNNFDATIGGPVRIPKVYNGKDKLFFFFAYAGVRSRQPARATDINDTVPTALQRAGDFSEFLALPNSAQYQVYDPLTIQPDPARPSHYIRTMFPGNSIPQSRFNNPAYSFVSKYIPLPNNSTNPTAVNYLATSQVDNNNYNAFNQRTDYQISDKDRVTFRWNWSHYIEYYGDFTSTGLMTSDDTRNNISGVANWNHIFSSSTLLDVSVAANQWFQRLYNSGLTSKKPTDFGLPSYVDKQCQAYSDCSAPVFSLPGYNFYNGNNFGRSLSSYPKTRSQGVKANLSHIAGRHSLRGGIDFRDQVRNDVGFNGNSAGAFTFGNSFVRKDDDGNAPNTGIGLSWASFALGIPTSATIDNNTSLSQVNQYYGWYGQDTWRVKNNLTLTLGLRMEYETGPTERYNRAITYFDPAAQLPITAAAQAAYAASPLPQLPASAFAAVGGNAYAGTGGAPRALWQGQLMLLPRASAAWQFNPKMVFRAGYGAYYDTLSPIVEAANQAGFSRSTSTNISNDFGQTWLAGNPAAGISPLTDPFPVRSDGTRYDVPFGNSLGSSYQVGRGFGFTPYDRKHARVDKWRAGVQRQLTDSILVEASYWGQYAVDIGISKRLDYLPSSYWANGYARNNALASALNANVANPFYINRFSALKSSNPVLYQSMSTLGFFTSPTIQVNKLLRQYPQLNGLTENNAPLGKDRIHALELNFVKRFSAGFNLNASYTWMSVRQATSFDSEFDPEPTWYGSNNGRPRRLTLSGIYEFPFGKGRRFLTTGVAGRLIGGWQTSWTYQYQPGGLLNFATNDFYSGDINRMSEALKNSKQSLAQWFNTGAGFERNSANGPAGYQIRMFPQFIDGVRGDKQSVINANIRRDFRIQEKATFQIRLDALNVQNRSQFNDPDTNPFNSTFGQITSQTGSTNRFFDIQARVQF
jgi:hypothetical protein